MISDINSEKNNNDIKILSIEYLRSKLTKWRLVSLVLFLIVLYHTFSGAFYNHEKKPNGDYIARLNIHGIIMNEKIIVEKLDKLILDKHVKGLILDVDSPGGAVLPSYKIYDKINEFKERTTKSVAVLMGSTAASGGYLISSPADYIVAHASTVTGSIGVLTMGADVTALADKLGIKPVIFKSGKLKAVPSPVEKINPDSEKMMNSIITDMKDQFLGTVIKERNIKDQNIINKIADAGIFTGRQAKEIGLIDSVGTLEDIKKWLKEKNDNIDYEIFDICLSKNVSFIDKVRGDPNSSASSNILKFIVNLLFANSSEVAGFYLF